MLLRKVLSDGDFDGDLHTGWCSRKPDPDAYEVVKVTLPPPLDNLGTEIRADERPETPDDPRTAQDRNIGGWVTGG